MQPGLSLRTWSAIQRGSGRDGRHSRAGRKPQEGEGENKSKLTTNPLSLDGRGIKEPVPVLDTGSEDEQDDTTTPVRHCGLDPQSRGTEG